MVVSRLAHLARYPRRPLPEFRWLRSRHGRYRKLPRHWGQDPMMTPAAQASSCPLPRRPLYRWSVRTGGRTRNLPAASLSATKASTPGLAIPTRWATARDPTKASAGSKRGHRRERCVFKRRAPRADAVLRLGRPKV